MGGPVAISFMTNKKRRFLLDVLLLLCYNDNNHETKISITKGELQKCVLSTLFFKKG